MVPDSKKEGLGREFTVYRGKKEGLGREFFCIVMLVALNPKPKTLEP